MRLCERYKLLGVTLPLRTVSEPIYPPETVDEGNLLGRICVSRPYYALTNPTRVGDTFYASAVADLPLGAEVGPMSSAEISRHAAISGTVRRRARSKR